MCLCMYSSIHPSIYSTSIFCVQGTMHATKKKSLGCNLALKEDMRILLPPEGGAVRGEGESTS